MLKSSYGRHLHLRVPDISDRHPNSLNDASLLDPPISGNRTGGGKTRVLTGPSTISGAGKGYSARTTLPEGRLITIYEYTRR